MKEKQKQQKPQMTEAVEQEEKTLVQTPESVYDRSELIAGSMAIFNVNPEIVVGALHGNEKQHLSVSEVKEAIQNFMNRKV